MSNILVVRSAQKYLTTSLINKIRELDHNVVEVAPDMNALSKNLDQNLDVIMVLADPELIEEQKALIFLRDNAVEKDLPLFLLGAPNDLDELKQVVPGSIIQGEFVRPFDVKEIAEKVDAFVGDQNTGVKKKILVVDDSGVMLRNVKNLLGKKYQVILANSGAMAIKYLSMDRPDLVLLDYEMPIINGKQVLETIRSEKDFEGVPVIFLTGRNDRESIMGVMNLKPEGYLLKSMKAEDFTRAIDEFFEKRKSIK